MRLDHQQIDSLIEAQYHYFMCDEPQKAIEAVGELLEPLSSIGRFPELLDILERALNTLPDADKRLWLFHARSLSALGRHEEALGELESIEIGADDLPELKAAVLIDKGHCLRRMGDGTQAHSMIDYYDKAFKLYKKTLIPAAQNTEEQQRYTRNKAHCLFNIGAVYQYFLRNYEQAMSEYQQALEIYLEVKSIGSVGAAYKQMGEIYGLPGSGRFYNPELALEYFNRALAIFRENDLQVRRLEALYQLGRLSRNRPEQSLTVFQQYVEVARSLGLLREESIAKRHIAELEYALHKQRMAADPSALLASESEQVYLQCIELLDEAVHGLESIESDIWSRRALANSYYLLGKLWLELNNTRRAAQNFEKSIEVCEEAIFRSRPAEERGDIRRRLKPVSRMLQIYFRADDYEHAHQLVEKYRKDYEALGLNPPTAEDIESVIERLETGD